MKYRIYGLINMNKLLKKIGKALDPRVDERLIYRICECGCTTEDHQFDSFYGTIKHCKRCECMDWNPKLELNLTEYVDYLSLHVEEWNKRQSNRSDK